MIRPTLAITLAISTVALGCGGGPPPNQFELQSTRYLEAAYDQMLGGRGYSLEEEISGSLRNGASETYEIRLRGNRAYAILGACDNDCNDMDLFLDDSRGNQIDQDIATDDFPVVRHTPRRNGDYVLRVRMYDCEVSPCFFAVGVYSRDR